MAEPYHSIEEKAESAVLAWINDCINAAGLVGLNTEPGFDTEDLAYPLLTVEAIEAEPDDDNGGNYAVTLMITVTTAKADQTRAEHATLAGYVFDVINGRVWVDVSAEINALSPTDFTAYTYTPGVRTRFVGEDDTRVTQQQVMIDCAPSTI